MKMRTPAQRQSTITIFENTARRGHLRNPQTLKPKFAMGKTSASVGTSPPAFSIFAVAMLEKMKKLDEAEAEFRKVIEANPSNASALNYLGYMWTEHDENLPKAREMIEKAVKLEPKNAAYLDSMAWVLFKQNQPKEALDYILQAVKLSDEPDATVFDHLGDIYAALKQSDKAREAWQKSVSLEANDQVRKKLGEKKSE